VTGDITYGGYADRIVVREKFVLRVPDALDSSSPHRCCAPASPCGRRCGSMAWARARRWRWSAWAGSATWGVKLAGALGAEVTVITTSPGKADDARALGAHHVLLSTDPKAMLAATNAFDFILDTIPKKHNVNPYLMLLGREGALVVVGAIELLEPVHGGC
jgi:uncharacterized zinc-type alcohol dehydrogenase-like protein